MNLPSDNGKVFSRSRPELSDLRPVPQRVRPPPSLQWSSTRASFPDVQDNHPGEISSSSKLKLSTQKS